MIAGVLVASWTSLGEVAASPGMMPPGAGPVRFARIGGKRLIREERLQQISLFPFLLSFLYSPRHNPTPCKLSAWRVHELPSGQSLVPAPSLPPPTRPRPQRPPPAPAAPNPPSLSPTSRHSGSGSRLRSSSRSTGSLRRSRKRTGGRSPLTRRRPVRWRLLLFVAFELGEAIAYCTYRHSAGTFLLPPLNCNSQFK